MGNRMKTVLVLAGILLVVSVLVYCLTRSTNQPEAIATKTANEEAKALVGSLDPKNLMITTAEQSRKRVLALGLSLKGSEDVSGMLIRPKVNQGGKTDEYPPDESTEWIVDISVPDGTILKRETILNVFNQDWRNKHYYSEIYGHSPETKKWTFVRAADVPQTYDKLAIGVPLAGVGVSTPMTVEALKNVFSAITDAAKELKGATCKARSTEKPAAEKSTKIFGLIEKYEDEEALIVLDAGGKTFEGKDIWDTMMSLGLNWGDGDLFHWENEQDNAGDDHLFSVATHSGPTAWYFIPEHIAEGKFKAGDLVFSFSIPRSADPLRVFDNMLKAAKYAQKRLGGTLEGPDGTRLDEQVIRNRLQKVVEDLTSAGFPPGAHRTMTIL